MERKKGGHNKEQREIVIAYIEKYAGVLSKKAIGQMLFTERPDLFNDDEHARQRVRYYCGQTGKRDRYEEHADRGNLFFSDFPEPPIKNLYHDIGDEKSRILLISDIHVPFHDKTALDTAINYGINAGADRVILNGDTFDHYTESTHDKDLGNRDPEKDYEQYQALLFNLRCAFPDAKILFKIGNHEHRYHRWFIKSQMADMLKIKAFRYEHIMQFEQYQVEHVDDYTTITVAGLNIIHGHEYRGGGGSVNPARWLSLRTKDSAICGHFHRSSEHNEKKHRGDIQTWWSAGCLCDLTPKYMPYNNWNHGFAFVIKDGEYYHVKNKRIFQGQIL